MEQTWRVYAPKDRDTSYDCQANLRTIVSVAFVFGSPLRSHLKADWGDDIYLVNVYDEEVAVVARERGQRTQSKGVFDDREEGIFYCVSDGNERAVESAIVKTFM